jgi:hypothetical protein
MYTNIPALSAADLIILLQSFTILLTVTILVYLTEDTDIDNELNSSDIVMTHVGESKDSHIVITRKGEAVVKPRWCGDRIPQTNRFMNVT